MTNSIITVLKEDNEVNEDLCRMLRLIRKELNSAEDGDLALRQIIITPVEDANILDLKDDIFNMIEFGPKE